MKESELNGDASVGTNAKARNGPKISDAHFWLRSYDAFNEPRKLLDDTDPKRKRALKAGPSEIAKKFKCEGIKKTFKRGAVDTFNTSAKGMIDKKGYQKLVIIVEAAPTKTIDREMRRMAAKSSSRKD